MRYARIVVTLAVIGTFFGIVFAFTQEARYSYPAPSPTSTCKEVQNIERALVDLTVDKNKAVSLAKKSPEFENSTAGYSIQGTQVMESFTFNVFSCSFPKILSVNAGFLLNNGTKSHVLIFLEDPSLDSVKSTEITHVGQYRFFKEQVEK